jgi:hypothetical protein
MRRVLIVMLSVVLLSFALTFPASAATEAQKLSAILNGLAHLDAVQCNTAGSLFGSWGTSQCGGYGDAFTGAALFAFLTQQAKWPAGAVAAKYATDVTNGVNYLLSTASTQTVTTNDNGVNICPGGAGSCQAIYWNTCGEPTYCTGFVATSLDTYALTVGPGSVATASGPLAGLTWTQIAQGITNAYAAGQATVKDVTDYDGPANGGWRYTIPSNDGADMSTAQWGALASGYDESVGAVTPANVKPALQAWLTFDASGGQACYEGGTDTCGIGPTNSENGAWLVSNAFAGGGNTAGVLAFLNTNWKTSANNTWYGNFGHTYAMWSSYKGLEAAIGLKDTAHITNLMTACGAPSNLPGSGVCNWWEDYNEWLVNVTPRSTDSGGNLFWAGDPDEGGWQDPLSTAVFTAIIGAAALPTTITTPTPVSVPALSRWGLVALGILLVTFAAIKLRGPRTA